MAIKDEGIKLALDAIERLASTQNVVQDGKIASLARQPLKQPLKFF